MMLELWPSPHTALAQSLLPLGELVVEAQSPVPAAVELHLHLLAKIPVCLRRIGLREQHVLVRLGLALPWRAVGSFGLPADTSNQTTDRA